MTKWMKVLPVCAAAAWAALIAAPAQAQDAQNKEWCENKTNSFSADQQFAGCDALLKSGKREAWIYGNRGISYEIKGNHDRAIADFDEALRLDPKFAKAYFQRAEVYYAKGDYDRAIADFGDALGLDPKFVFAYHNRGNAYDRKGDFDRAITDYNEALRLSKFPAAYYNRGIAYRAKGDFDHAIADFGEAIRLYPKFAEAHRGRGLMKFAQSDFEAAIGDFQTASDGLKSSYYPLLLEFLARVGLKQDGAGELAAAASRVEHKSWPLPIVDFYLGRKTPNDVRSSAADPDQRCGAAFYIGEWQFLRGDKKGAAPDLQTAIKTCPQDSDEYFLALASLMQGGGGPVNRDQAMLAPQPTPSPSPAAASNSVTSFTWTYNFQPEPGKRTWTRNADGSWAEQYPSGRVAKVYDVVTRGTADGCPGAIVSSTQERDFEVFIPDAGCPLMVAKFRRGNGAWSNMAAMNTIRTAAGSAAR